MKGSTGDDATSVQRNGFLNDDDIQHEIINKGVHLEAQSGFTGFAPVLVRLHCIHEKGCAHRLSMVKSWIADHISLARIDARTDAPYMYHFAIHRRVSLD